jgi:hypothetical protein
MMARQLKRSGMVGSGLLMALLLGTSATAGVLFRLEIGPPSAGETSSKRVKAVMMVRGLACDDPASIQMTGTAEGFVAAGRRSMRLELVETTPGVFAVPRPPDGQWVLNLTGSCPGRSATASVLVPLGGPSGFRREKAQFLEVAAKPAQIDAALSALVAGTKP